jgi:hypothetical protein
MNSETAPSSSDVCTDPALAVAERQLVLLGELAELTMAVSRAYAASAVAAAEAEAKIVSEPWFTPEIGRARACGAKDAAESLQKVTRALRLTFILQKTVAETVRDLRAGIVAAPKATASVRGEKPARIVIDESPAPSAPRRDVDDEGNAARVERPGGERERLFDVERPDRLPRGAYCKIVDDLAAAVGATVDWETATVRAPAPLAGMRGGGNEGLNHQAHQEHQDIRAEPAPSG